MRAQITKQTASAVARNSRTLLAKFETRVVEAVCRRTQALRGQASVKTVSASYHYPITPPVEPPVAVMSITPETGVCWQPFRCTNQSTGGAGETFSWQVKSGSTVLATSSEENPEFNLNINPGTYHIIFDVTNEAGTSRAESDMVIREPRQARIWHVLYGIVNEQYVATALRIQNTSAYSIRISWKVWPFPGQVGSSVASFTLGPHCCRGMFMSSEAPGAQGLFAAWAVAYQGCVAPEDVKEGDLMGWGAMLYTGTLLTQFALMHPIDKRGRARNLTALKRETFEAFNLSNMYMNGVYLLNLNAPLAGFPYGSLTGSPTTGTVTPYNAKLWLDDGTYIDLTPTAGMWPLGVGAAATLNANQPFTPLADAIGKVSFEIYGEYGDFRTIMLLSDPSCAAFVAMREEPEEPER